MNAGTTTSPGGVRIDRVVTSGQFCLDGGAWDVDNNVWVVGDDREVVVIDAAHDAHPILDVVGGRRVVANVLTHGHNDHINAVGALHDAVAAPVWLNEHDRMLWDDLFPDGPSVPDHNLVDGTEVTVGDVTLRAMHTPGHSPGSVCLYSEALGAVFTGDTLFNGGPGATGRSYSHFPTIIESIETRLLTLPPRTVVLTGHGDSTTVGAEAPHLQEWVDRGH
ncbi:MAG: MBL fold metallo-hydrolase [Nocardioidaceae bacterium]